jgi:hypothetical protein
MAFEDQQHAVWSYDSEEQDLRKSSPGDQLSLAIFDQAQSPKTVMLQLENLVGIIERLLPVLDRHWLKFVRDLLFRIPGGSEFSRGGVGHHASAPA